MMKNPSVIDSPSDRVPKKASIWDLLVLEIAAVEKAFRGLLCWFHDFREFIEAKLGQTEPRGPPVAPPTYSFLLYIPTYPQTTRYGAKTLIPPP